MNAQERLVMILHKRYNVLLKYQFHYEYPYGKIMGTNKQQSVIGKVANELLAMCTIFANCYDYKHSNNITQEEIIRMRRLCDKFTDKRNNLIRSKGLYVEWSKKNPTFFIITRKFEPIAHIVLNK